MKERGSVGTATVLFTDLVGSTELMSRLGDSAFDRLREEHVAALRKTVDEGGGDVVKNTGDGLLATFMSTSGALTAAVAAQQATERQGRASEVALAIRVGLSVGEVAFDDGDVFGTPVVEAARLVGAARPGQILATAVVRAVAGSRAGVTFIDLGAMELKGLPDPVAVCEVGWEPQRGPSLPLPLLLAKAGRVFVGRARELEHLGRLWKEAGAGDRRLVLVGGEPGAGKTRLAAEVAGAIHAEGGLVLAGACDEDLGVPYQPFVEALRHYAVHAPEPRLGRHGGELRRFVPEVAERVGGLSDPLRSDPETERYRLFDAVAGWLSAASTEAPILLVLDDIQWAAKPTLLLLRHVFRSAEPIRLLVLATYRDTDLRRGDSLSEFLADLPRISGAERLPLSGLDLTEVSALLQESAGHDLGEDGSVLARVVWRETEGNAFFVKEVVRHLVESGGLERRDGRWVLTGAIEDVGIPEGVRDVVGRRLARLSDDANGVLAAASVAGLEFEPAVVEAAGGFDEDTVLSALDEAFASRLVIDVPGAVSRSRFAHALVRATLYDGLTSARRASFHRKTAEAIEAVHARALDDHLPALAHHWSRASTSPAATERAVDYATRAGDRSLAQLAHDEAVVYYRQGIEILDSTTASTTDDRRLRLLISLGEALRRAGDPYHRQVLLEAAALADSVGDADALARAALANNRGIFSVSERVDEELVSVLELALDRHSPADSPTRARLLALLGEELAFSVDHQRRSRIADEALAMARRVAEPATLAHVLVRRYTPLVSTPERHAEMVELAEIARRIDDPALVFWAHCLLMMASFSIGETGRAASNLADAVQLAEEIGQPVMRWFATFFSSSACRIAGELGDAETRGQEAFEIGRAAGMKDAFGMHAGNMYFVRYDRGRLDEMLEVVERAGSRPDPRPIALVWLGLIYRELDRLDEAQALLNRLAEDGFRSLPKNFAWTTQMALTAEICAGVGDREHAATLHSLLFPYRDLLATTGGGATGAMAHQVGLLATVLERFDEADAHYAAAAARHEQIPAPAWLARTRLEWAQMLLRRRQPGDADRAHDLLGGALDTARVLGLGTIERRVTSLLTM